MTVVRPPIANQVLELDARPPQENPVVTWEDLSVEGNDATGVGSPVYEPAGWPSRLFGAVRLTNATQHFTLPAAFSTDVIGTPLTVFVVFDAITQSPNGPQILGGTGAVNLGRLFIVGAPDGRFFFGFFDTGAGHNDINALAGTIVTGNQYVVTCRHSNTSGKIIRVDGIQKAANAAGTSNLASNPSPYVGRNNLFATDQRIAWLSINATEVTDVEITQMEAWLAQEFGPLSGFPRAAVVPERASGLASPGAVKRRTNAGLTQIRSITGLGWSWEESYPLLRVTDPEHAELMAFIKAAWHSGRIFSATHPLRPGSGITPNGLGTANILVKGADQVGASVLTDGWPASTAACVVTGDVIQLAGEPAVYVVADTAASNAAGEVLIRLNPPLRSTPADNAPVKTTGVEFQVTILSRSRFEPAQPPDLYGDYRVTLAEALL